MFFPWSENFRIKFFFQRILIDLYVYLPYPTDDKLASLSNLRYTGCFEIIRWLYTFLASVAGAQRIKTIIKCNKVYEDQKFEELEEKTSSDKDFYILCHRSCVSIYTSKSHLKICLSPGNALTEAGTSTTKIKRRSEVPNFNFKNDCLYCEQKCEVEKNKKNRHRWRPSFQFRALEYKVKKISNKEAILQTCVERNDT